MYQKQETSYYDLLEVKPDADSTQILEAYQRAKQVYSPNSPALYSMFTEDEARELLKLVDEAFSTLSNRSRRRAYDLKMGLITEASAIQEDRRQTQKEIAHHPSTRSADPAWDGSVKIHKIADALPEGYKKTRFGSYKQDASFEADISAVEECDGSFLERIREYKGVSIEDLSEVMKISKSTLRALEQNSLDQLPVEVFTRGIVVQMAKMLGLDDQKIAKAYMAYYRANVKIKS